VTGASPAVLARVARAWVAACALAALALAACFHVSRLATWWVELLRYLPFPIYLAPALVAVVVSWALPWGWRVVSIATVALVLTGVMGFEWHRGEHGDVRMRVMTFNAKAHQGAGVEVFARIAAEIAAQDPDVLVMQDSTLAGETAMPAPLRAVLGSYQLHLSGQYVVASRYPLRDCRDVPMRAGADDSRYVRCELFAHGHAMTLVTAHLASPRQGLNAARREGLEGLDDWNTNLEHRLTQAGTIVRDLSGAPRPLILAGDLNAPEHSPVVQALLRLGLRDAFGAAGAGYGYTHGHSLRPGFSFLRIDHILVSPQIGVADCYAGGSAASEHRPVIADLLLRRQ